MPRLEHGLSIKLAIRCSNDGGDLARGSSSEGIMMEETSQFNLYVEMFLAIPVFLLFNASFALVLVPWLVPVFAVLL